MFQVLLCPYGYKTCGWQVKLCDPIKHRACLSASSLTKECAIKVRLLHYIYITIENGKYLCFVAVLK